MMFLHNLRSFKITLINLCITDGYVTADDPSPSGGRLLVEGQFTQCHVCFFFLPDALKLYATFVISMLPTRNV